PPQYVEQRVMLVFPPDLTKTDDDKRAAQEWANALGLALAPTDVSPAGATGPPLGTGPGAGTVLPAVIFSPTPGQSVAGPIQITGVANSPNFLSYRLEYGSGPSP